MEQLQTVTGLAPLEEVKLVDAHAHVWIKPPEGVGPKFRFELDNPRLIEAELKDFRSAGGTTLIDCQPGGCGRDAQMLAKLAEAAELQITATTGFHLERYYPSGYWLWSASEEAAVSYFVNELTAGLQEKDDVLATTIKVGYEGEIKDQTRILMEAAAEAARQTGAALLFHTEEGRNVEALPLFFEDRGVPTGRLYLCHMDKRPDLGLHRELAQAGALLGYDTFVRPTYRPRQNVWPLLLEMVQGDMEDHIAIGLDMARSAMWRHYGGEPGLVALPDRLLSHLHGEGLSEEVVTKLTGENIARFLVRRSTAPTKPEEAA
jgi:phosphotriesterase-related protein